MWGDLLTQATGYGVVGANLSLRGTRIESIPMGIVSSLPVWLGFVVGRNQESKLISALASVEKVLDLGVPTPAFIK